MLAYNVPMGVGDTSTDTPYSFNDLLGSSAGALIVGVGLVLIVVVMMSGQKDEEPRGKRRVSGERKKYVSYVSKKHKLSKADQDWLEEHEEA